MKLLLDHQIFSSQNVGGISRYFCNLISEYKAIDPSISISLPISYHKNQHLTDIKHLIKDNNLSQKRGFQLFRNYQKENDESIKKTLEAKDYDVFHATYYDKNLLKYIANKPLVITIHDMIHELYPEFFSLKDNTANHKRELALRADKIITVSENTKKDLLRFIKLDEKKIEVVPLASSFKATKTSNNQNDTHKYLLFVGNRSIYKNFYFMVSSIADLLRQNYNLHLICFGHEFSKKELAFLENLKIKEKVKTNGKTDAELVKLYQNALAFIMPSYYEGFGIPTLEAMSCGCPVLAANKSSIPEVASDAALYFDPKDAQSIRSSVEKILSDNQLRESLIKKGYQRNDLFSWNKTAEKTMKIYNSLI
ncbi:MAG: glycosyltransferase family 4 protein [Pelagibacterales bacterium]|nr:glycosyltransferase family 4 protein [Pelagibacterales bacterium]